MKHLLYLKSVLVALSLYKTHIAKDMAIVAHLIMD